MESAGSSEKALESSDMKTTEMEDELVKKSRKASAGRFLLRRLDTEVRKVVSVLRQAMGKNLSEGTIGEYHHLT